ncbi:MAG: DMT family transporter [Candidatus Puniceispirillaceae bacterium]
MALAHLFALGAALSWTLAGLFSHQAVLRFGSLHFNRLRMLAAAFLLVVMIALTDGSFVLPMAFWQPVLFSAVVGVVLGDYFLFVAMRRLGPRRTAILFAGNAPIAAILSWLFLDEILSAVQILAILVGFAGICFAIIYGKRRDLLHIWEAITPPLWIGLAAGFLAATGQAIGVLMLRPVMHAGADPLLVGLIRVSVAALIFWLSWPFDRRKSEHPLLPDARMSMLILANGFFGLGFGVFLLLKALEIGSVAEVTILSSVSPVMILPFVWYKTGKCPPWGAWLGALLVVASTILL